MHIGHGSHVVYSVYPFSEIVFSRLVALRTVRTSAWLLGSFSLRTAFSARSSVLPVAVSTTIAPNGTGEPVSIDRAVNATRRAMKASSAARTATLRERTESVWVAMRQSITPSPARPYVVVDTPPGSGVNLM